MAKSQVNSSYFVGPLTIAQLTEPSVVSNLNYFIAKHADEVIELLLGKPLFDAYVAGMTGSLPYDAKWVTLDGKLYDSTNKISPAANYVYFFYQRNLATETTGTGEKILKAENAISVSNAPKAKLMWNDMVKQNQKLIEFVKANPNDYPEYADPVLDTSTEETIRLYRERTNVLRTLNPFF